MHRLLVVDDEKEILDWLYMLFCDRFSDTLEVLAAVNVIEATKLIASKQIDIAVFDINMPGMTGLDLFQVLRQHHPHSRVIFLTGYSEFDYVYTAIQHEGIQFLLKSEDDATIISAVSKACAHLAEASKADVSVATESDPIKQIKLYINEHLPDNLSLACLAELFHFNPSYLSRLFKAETGTNLSDYITEMRVERAKLLLQDYKLKIYDVSSAVGFESPHYFTRFFKKSTGLTPYEYRRKSTIR